MSTETDPLKKMREPFLATQISKMCRSTKKDNTKGNCPKCGGYHGLPAIQLDYVGHAMLTHRMLDADPNWTWEPLALDSTGYPVIDKDGGMWIKLTIGGVTRLGYGDAQGKTGGDAMKERIGDALRNAAMRFGAALDLWHKGDLYAGDDVEEKKEEKKETKEEAKLPEVAQTLSDELAAYCLGDVEQANTLLKRLSHYEADGKTYSFDLAKLPKTSEKWCKKVLAELRKHVAAAKQSLPDGFCHECQCEPCVCG